MQEETFGPVIPVMKVSSDDEAVSLMNDSKYGLSASVWTKDVGRGEELIEELEAGTVFLNRCDYPSPVSLLFFNIQVPSFLLSERIGPRMDGLEAVWIGMYFGTAWLRGVL